MGLGLFWVCDSFFQSCHVMSQLFLHIRNILTHWTLNFYCPDLKFYTKNIKLSNSFFSSFQTYICTLGQSLSLSMSCFWDTMSRGKSHFQNVNHKTITLNFISFKTFTSPKNNANHEDISNIELMYCYC